VKQLRPTISAVIPTYNREGTIGRAIDSVLAQEFAPAEIIVIDDGSTDRTSQILAGYGTRIRCVHQANAGVAAARNHGVELAAADWIAFLDSDDFWLPHHLKQLASAISETKARAALYFSDLYTSNSNSGKRRWELSGLTVKEAYELREDAVDWAFMRVQPMMLQGRQFAGRHTWIAARFQGTNCPLSKCAGRQTVPAAPLLRQLPNRRLAQRTRDTSRR
jgi:glycosyltransferase involved in cell wall biosynthesis